MTTKKNLTALVLSAALVLGLGGCGGEPGTLTGFDAKVYVDGLLRETYLGEYPPEYLKLVDLTQQEAQETYRASLELEVSNCLTYYGITSPTAALREDLARLYEEIYSHAKFEVTSAAGQEDGSFTVKVSVEPIDTIRLARDGWADAMAEYYKQYPTDDRTSLSDEQREEADSQYAAAVLELLRSVLPETGNLAAEEILVQLTRDGDGVYSLSSAELGKLDARIIDYPTPN